MTQAITSAAPVPALATRERIRQVAERLFAEKGFDAVSLRMITAEAAVNLAAVNYHFGSKEALIETVISHRIGPVNEERVSRLKAAAKAGKKSALAVGVIVDCFVGPVIEVVEESTQSDSVLCGLIGRIMGDQDERIKEIVAAQFPEVMKVFIAEFSKALSKVPKEVLAIRLLFMAGSLVQSLLCFTQLDKMPGVKARSLTEVKHELIPFLIAGIASPVHDVEA